MVLTHEALVSFLKGMRAETFQPDVVIVSPRMHRKVYILVRMKGLFRESPRAIRKVQARRIVARRKRTRRRVEAAYERRYPALLR